MDNRRLYLGIDTSNYKTSVAVIDDENLIVFERSELLEVKKGSRGLRQSEAFFQHSMRLPAYIEDVFKSIDPSEIAAIACSDKPRRQPGSYMPCFNAGINTAKTLSAVLLIPVFHFSHQEGHAAAVIPQTMTGRSLFMHLSGGTSEYLIIEPDNEGYDMQIAGGTKDISFGQLLDRIGVALGYPFPSGRYLDELACACSESDPLIRSLFPRVQIDDGRFNLSGAETKILRYISENDLSKDDHDRVADLSAGLFRYISDILITSAGLLSDKYGIGTVYMAGGVASSRAVREIISENCKIDIRFGAPVLSGDNAVGIARLAKRISRS